MSKHLQGVMAKHFWRVGAATGIALVAVLVVCAPAQATVVKLSVPKMSRMATTVVVGRVASATPRHVSGHGWGSIVTDTTLRIDTVLKGTAPATLTLHLPGGRIGDLREVVEDVPTLVPGDSYILFLDGKGRIVGWSEGALPVVGGAVPALGGAPLRAAEGVIRRAAHPSLTGSLQRSAGEATLAQPALASPLAPLPASVTADSTVTLLSSDFEAGMSGWTLAGSPTWGRTTYREQAGSYSAFCAQSTIAAPGPYANNMSNWMVAGPFDLSDANSATLSFDTWFDLASNDWLMVGFSTDGSTFDLMGWQGVSSGGWYHDTEDLSSFGGTSYIGQPQAWVAFQFTSDASGTAEGAYVDNVLLTKQTGAAPTITTIMPASASAGTGSHVTLIGTGFGATQGTGSVNFYYDGTDTIPGPVTSWSDTQIVCMVPTATVKGYPASTGSGPVTVTDGTGTTGPSYNGFSVPFGYGGTKWSGLGMTYRVNPNTADTTNAEALADAGASTWNGNSLFGFTDGGLCSTSSVGYDGHDDIFWGTGLPAGVLAQASYWFSGSTLSEADIEFNDSYTWSDGSGSTYDVQSIATHELGHTLNLRDLYGANDTSKVMYGYGSSGQQKRTLDPGDAAGIAWIYGSATPMSGTMVLNNDAGYTKSTTVTLDSAIVGATQMHFRNQGGSWSAWEAYSSTKSWTLAAGGDGVRTVEAEYKDAAANIYAQSDSITLDATAPTTAQSGGGSAWHATDATVTFTPSDAGSGMSGGSAKTQYSTNGGTTWTTGTSVTIVADPAGHTTDGVHTISYRSTDAIGNVETVQTTNLNIDTTPPKTTLVPARLYELGYWNNAPCSFTFTASDAGSGVAQTQLNVDKLGWLPWSPGTSDTLPAPADHSNDGTHTLLLRSVDVIGNLETAQQFSLGIDTRRPSARTPYASTVRRYAYATLKFKVLDAQPSAGSCRVVIRVKTLSGRLKAKFSPTRWYTCGTLYSYRFRCRLAHGKYTFSVTTYDGARNVSAKAAHNYLTVR